MKFWLVMCLNTSEIIECFVSKEKGYTGGLLDEYDY